MLHALERAAEAAQHDRHADKPLRPALVLLVDQLEELFAQTVSDADRAAFAEVLKQLIVTRSIWTVATLRADLYELAIREPTLKALKESGASLDLGPPDSAELADIVRAPAQAAGLIYQSDPAEGALDDRLLADAATPDSLPLLQFTLQQLYERRVATAEGSLLTHQAYDRLGGLAGAIAAEAERAVSGLKPEAVATLPRLLRRLTEPAHDGRTLTLREALRSEVEADPSEAALLNALRAAFIVIAGTDAAGRPVVRLAHRAVFESWSRAANAAKANQDFLRVRAEVEDALRPWQEHGRPSDRLIQPGVPLAEAEDLVRRFRTELPAELTGYVKASGDRARLRHRLVAAAAVCFLIVAVAAGLGWKIARDQRDRAQQALSTIVRTAAALMGKLRDEAVISRLPADLVDRMLDSVIQLAPNDPTAYNLRAVAYALKGDYDRAIQDHDQAIQLDPNNPLAYWNRGDAYLNKGEYDRAIRDYDRVVQLDPNNARAYNARAGVFARKGDYDRAIHDYDRVIQLDPKNGLAYAARGEAYRYQGDYDRAIQDYDQAIQLDPKIAPAHTGRGLVSFYLGKFDAAAASLQRANELQADAYAMIWRYLALEHIGEDGVAGLADAARPTRIDWPRPVIDLYLGRSSPGELLASASSADQRCEAQFYIGEWHLLRRDRDAAAIALRVAADTCPRLFIENAGAVAELKRLG